MAWYNEDNPDTLNFIVTGNHHSGYGLLQSALSAHPHMVCHGDVLHADDKIRKSEHESYFGVSGKVPDWYIPTHLSVEQYLNNKIFDNTLHEEQAVGVKVNYAVFTRHDLWDYVDQRCRHGDFCLVHVVRNPVACFVAWKQDQGHNGLLGPSVISSTVYVDPPELIQFVRDHVAIKLKIDHLCPDRAVVPYHELLLDFRGTLEKLFHFLELPFSPACVFNQMRVHRHSVRSRVANWTQLKTTLPSDVREFLECPSLF